MVETTDEINLVKEIERLESMYIYCRKLYRRVRFLCCSSETKRFKERKKYLKSHLEEAKHLAITTPASS